LRAILKLTQIVDTESSRADDFLFNLRRIEFQAAIIADNPTYDLNAESTRNLVEEKSRDLMTAIVRFFDSALIYFSRHFVGMLRKICRLTESGTLAKSLAEGTKCYEDTQKHLDVAIREYDQAVLHLAARAVAGTLRNSF
jgi:hypothetical protein